MLSPEEPVAIRAADADEAQRAATGLRAVGFLDVAGYLLDGADEAHTETLTLVELEELVAAGAVEVLDVREPDERDDGFIPGSRNVPYRLVRQLADDLRTGKPVVTICSTGPRAAVAASALAHEGIDARPVVGGGVEDWQADGAEMVAFRRCGGH
jgi:rhodanese-related sulfurtransferase